jgi:hypothetical protein
MKLRIGSLASVGILGVAAWVVLARSGLVLPEAQSIAVRVATWAFAGFLSLNTIGNIASKSPVERKVMTPASLLLALCFVIVAWS